MFLACWSLRGEGAVDFKEEDLRSVHVWIEWMGMGQPREAIRSQQSAFDKREVVSQRQNLEGAGEESIGAFGRLKAWSRVLYSLYRLLITLSPLNKMTQALVLF